MPKHHWKCRQYDECVCFDDLAPDWQIADWHPSYAEHYKKHVEYLKALNAGKDLHLAFDPVDDDAP